LLQGLNDNFAETRELAAIGLGKFGRHAIPAVEDVRRAAARDCDSLVRCYAAYALWQIDGRPEPSARFLANELGNKAGPCVPELAALLLGRMGPDALDALPSLCKLLDDKSPSSRAQAVFALGKIGPGAVSAVPLLCNSLRDSADAQQLLSEESNLSVRDLEYQGDIPRISFRIVRKAPWELLRGTLRYRSVRSFAAIALGRIGCADGTVIAALKTLKSESLIGTKDHQAADEALSILAP
jgi:HEAT repeat protein